MSAHFSWPSDIRSIIDFTALLKIDGICEHVHQKKQFPRSMCRSVCIRYLLRMVSVILVHQKGLINIVAMKTIVKEGTLSKLTQRNRRLYQYITDWKRFEISKENIYVLLFLLKNYITAKYISAGHLTSFNRSWFEREAGHSQYKQGLEVWNICLSWKDIHMLSFPTTNCFISSYFGKKKDMNFLRNFLFLP